MSYTEVLAALNGLTVFQLIGVRDSASKLIVEKQRERSGPPLGPSEFVPHRPAERHLGASGRFMRGQTVTFFGRGATRVAIVERVNSKSLSLNELATSHKPGQKWRVSPHLCKPFDDTKAEVKPAGIEASAPEPAVPATPPAPSVGSTAPNAGAW